MTWMEWYDSLAKPSWTPAPATISLIWMILYVIILVSFGFVFVQTFRSKLPRLVALPFAVNLVANLLFMPIFSGLRDVPLSAQYCSAASKASAFAIQKRLNFARASGRFILPMEVAVVVKNLMG